jgi:hypothetical protein
MSTQWGHGYHKGYNDRESEDGILAAIVTAATKVIMETPARAPLVCPRLNMSKALRDYVAKRVEHYEERQ